MWLSFWVAVSFGILFLLVEIVFDWPLPIGVGLIPATAISFMTNGWEGFWHWKVHFHDKLCVQAPSGGELKCWDATSQQIPDMARPPEPPGWVEVVMPWYDDRYVGEWLLTGVPLDLAASAVAAGVLWLALRPFGRHHTVERAVDPFD
ncbi:hypothetical protein [Humibacillus xanthopallidus]|uniref:hypothetical protein n=1 Tax=Humibacillus xanthopallidus TaxID=412689 RepID=UPI00384AF82E